MNGVENQSGGVMGEVLIAPLEQVIAQIGQEIAQAQGAIDVGSMTTQRNIEGNPSLKDLGIEAPWYHMAEVELDLKMMSIGMKITPFIGFEKYPPLVFK